MSQKEGNVLIMGKCLKAIGSCLKNPECKMWKISQEMGKNASKNREITGISKMVKCLKKEGNVPKLSNEILWDHKIIMIT